MDTRDRFECCTDDPCTSGLRNNYYRGKKLTRNSYSLEQHYHIERRKLLNRAIHGWGVVYGFHLTLAADGMLEMDAGLALDKPGRELIQVGAAKLAVDDMIALDADGKPVKFGRDHGWDDRGVAWKDAYNGCWLLSVHYAERQVSPVDLQDPCSCARREYDQVCETVRYSLLPIGACEKCCRPYECGFDCECAASPCCGGAKPGTRDRSVEVIQTMDAGFAPQIAEWNGEILLQGRYAGGTFPKPIRRPIPASRPADRHVQPRGGCRCLCDHLTKLEIDDDCETFCWIDEPCARVRVDLRNGVPLACVKLTYGDCKWELTEIFDDCGPRRLVKRNDLLFDLIQGCDLTRIQEVGWEHWHRGEMPFQTFQKSFGIEVKEDYSLTSLYWVRFSRPVRKDTVRADSFAMTIVIADQPGGWGRLRRVPIVDVFKGPEDPAGHIEFAQLVVDGDWVAQHIMGRQSDFTHCSEILVEIRIHGDYIIDCNGQRIDGSVPGLHADPTGRVKSGGDLFSSFAVTAPDPDRCRTYHKRQQISQGA